MYEDETVFAGVKSYCLFVEAYAAQTFFITTMIKIDDI